MMEIFSRQGWLTTLALLVIFIAPLHQGCSIIKTSISEKAVKIDKSLNFLENENAQFLWADKNLEDQFSRYWTIRFSMNSADEIIDRSFQMEAPHIQEMVDKKKYAKYINPANRNNLANIRIENVTDKSEKYRMVDCYLAIETQEGIKEVSIRDHWLYLEGKWYHILKDRLFFPHL